MGVLLLGASSDLGHPLAALFAAEGKKVYLAGRRMDVLEKSAKDLQIRYNASVETLFFDANDTNAHHDFYEPLKGKITIVICLFGYLGDATKAQDSFEEAAKIIDTNYRSAVGILSLIATDFKERKQGCIVGVSSVAGERGRMSNYIYGSAKAGFTTFLDGLRNALYHHGVHVITVKPGFMDTQMTADLNLPGPLTAKPAQAAKAIYKAVKKKKDQLYVLWMWKWIMLIIRNIPEFIFKKMKL